MRTIQKCDESVFKGALVQWTGDALSLRAAGDVVGVAGSAPFEVTLDGSDEPVRVVELCLHGAAEMILSVAMPARGGRVFADGCRVTPEPNGFPVGVAIPVDLGDPRTELAAGDPVLVFLR